MTPPEHPRAMRDLIARDMKLARAKRISRESVEPEYVPTLADRMVREADVRGVAHVAAIDDAQDPWAELIGPDTSNADNR